MNIRDYIIEKNLTQKQFAESIGVSVMAVSMYTRNMRTPGRTVARRIIAETGGVVTWDDLYPDNLREQDQAKEAA